MLIDALSSLLDATGALREFWGKLDTGKDASLGVASSARPFLVAARFNRTPQTTLVVVPGEDAAYDFARTVAAYLGDDRVLRFPQRVDLPFDNRPADLQKAAMRMEALYALESGRECVVVASGRSLVRCVAPLGSHVCEPMNLVTCSEVGDTAGRDVADFEGVSIELDNMGYRNTGELEGPGSYCVHGGSMDIYPGNSSFPVRVDFFGDEVDEIRRIVPSTGQSIASLDSIQIFPVREFKITPQNRRIALRALAKSSEYDSEAARMYAALEAETEPEHPEMLLPYLYPRTTGAGSYLASDALVSLVEPRSIFDDALHCYEEVEKRASESQVTLEGLFSKPQQMSFGDAQQCQYLSIVRTGTGLDQQLTVKRTNVAGNSEKLFSRMRQLVDDRYAVVFSVPNYRARQDMKLDLVDRGIPITEILDATSGDGASGHIKLKRGVVNIVDVDIPLGIVLPTAHLALISIADTQGSGTVRTSRHVDITQMTFPYQPGDYVVHAAHGIALFKEIVNQDVGGATRDYLLLEYAEGDKLYVPVEQLDRVSRYVGPEGSSPRLTRLNTSDWSRALNKARKATKKLAFDLVDIYTRRAATQGFRYSPDTPWQKEMEDAFPYQETPDQLSAIADVKADMQSPKPMDRLICGDVGFGKTEVALRAAFKATQDNKQVMLLCPTTILAQQHYTTFKERFDPFEVSVEVLSRFRTQAQQRKILEDFAAGKVDVLVGTHRLLSRDVNPHDLGLLIIDEEQRFGVGAKEQLKNMRESVDVLTLSATPIPRTMQMSLSGVRDMSLILSPPDDRRPVKVFVGEWDPDKVADAIRRELDRHGQVYYVSNRVRTIDDAVERVKSVAGEARIGIAHGKMSKEELERVMEDFSAGEIDVLVATTIIESGIDNPHTNTLIIEDSQRLGLAQLYQLKGRVGRSSTQAYAYFMFPEKVKLTDEARERLLAIDEHQDLGSGMRIAMRDLEIRGAGSILGAEQSGNLSAVGFDLFAEMLSEAVNATREGRIEQSDLIPPALSDITVNVPVHMYLPEDYIPEVDKRVLLYRKLASSDSLEVLDLLEAETVKSYGDMPQAAKNFFDKARIKALAFEKGIHTIAVVAGNVRIEPVHISKEQSITFRRRHIRYSARSQLLTVPLSYFTAENDEESLLNHLVTFIEDL
ncbi:MAG: transcription-repair coupling factor [Eggerthellaceae bacterium]